MYVWPKAVRWADNFPIEIASLEIQEFKYVK